MSARGGSAAALRRGPSPSSSSRDAKTAATRKTSDREENQVVPFHLDDGTDDLEEIRRRRYSSSSSASSDDDDERATQQRGRGGVLSRPTERKKPKPAATRSARGRSTRDAANEWEKASASSHVSSSDSGSEDDREPVRRLAVKDHKARAEEDSDKPESPRKAAIARKKTQQSESEEDVAEDRDEEEQDEERDGPSHSTATTATHAPSSSPSTPRAPIADLGALSKLAVFPGSETQLLQGYVLRVRTLLHAQYHFFINDQLVLLAEKQLKNRTSNYHVFDMTRAAAGLSARLTKKSGNYIGKLRANFSKKKSVLVGNQSRKTELGAVLFGGNVSASEPRRVVVVLPPLNARRQEIDGVAVGEEPDIFSILVEHYKALKHRAASAGNSKRAGNKDAPHARELQLHTAQAIQVFENKQPVFENGFYRLNFNGRVSVPSVKNFQLVRSATLSGSAAASPAVSALQERERDVDGSTVYLQFGKVDEKKFHLDFRAPITPIQAFAVALAQFNL